MKPFFFRSTLVPAAAAWFALTAAMAAHTAHAAFQGPQLLPVDNTRSVRNDTSPALRDMARIAPIEFKRDKKMRSHKIPSARNDEPIDVDPLLARDLARGAVAQADPGYAVKLNIEGVGHGFTGPDGTYNTEVMPPDTTGAAGTTQYVQWVNWSWAIFDKNTGATLAGPMAGNTPWQGFGGPCEKENSGDPIVQFDRLAKRWVLSQFSLPLRGKQYQCVAVSTTDDALGSYHRYAFAYDEMNDFPKLSVWPDAYYATYNMFGRWGFSGPKVCALERGRMLAGEPARQVCFDPAFSMGSLLPLDLDGPPPPKKMPGVLVAKGKDALNFWAFRVNWAAPEKSRLQGPHVVAVAPFAEACGLSGGCVTQPGTSTTLDTLSDRLNYRAVYRHFGSHDAMVVSHAVSTGKTAGNRAAVRWYEVRDIAKQAPRIHQQGTIAQDDGAHRWMSSIAMDKQGNIAVGYNVSSKTVYPSIAISMRQAGDPLGTMRPEVMVTNGRFSQGDGSPRWGDYSHMSLDPVDDCTLSYTGEYGGNSAANSLLVWTTRIIALRADTCR